MAGELILVVDDNTTNLKLLSVLLRSEGYEVLAAQDAQQALEILRRVRPRLILMDLQMPGMDGFELTARIKADPSTRGIPVVAVTSYAMKGDEEKALAAGCDGYHTKPIDTVAFPAIVARYLAPGPSP